MTKHGHNKLECAVGLVQFVDGDVIAVKGVLGEVHNDYNNFFHTQMDT